MHSVEENLRLMKTLDEAWNAQDWETFDSRHAENVVVYWPGQPEPTRGVRGHGKVPSDGQEKSPPLV
jgi:hypothetical protein